MARAYYNEHDPHAAQWLRNLIAGGHIAPGDVDERSIEDVRPADLVGYRQCHFFAGIGVWSYALRAAGWPDDREIWTGSCPCQPFSAAGAGSGFADERHLWPAFFYLIRAHVEWCRQQKRRPPAILGEQVASKDADPWIDLVCADMEAVDYAFGAVAFPSAGVGAPHIRDRLYWAAIAGALVHAQRAGLEGHGRHGDHGNEPGRLAAHPAGPVAASGAAGGLAHATRRGFGELGGALESRHVRHADSGGDASGGLADAERDEQRERRGPGREGASGNEPGAQSGGRSDLGGLDAGAGAGVAVPGPTNGFWRDVDWLFCRDGKWRPVEPGTFPLAHAAPARVGRLRAYGNAINTEAAIEFILSVKAVLA